jgi:uncharacterized protein YuzE
MSKKGIINYDKESDIIYIVTKKGTEDNIIEVSPGINVELNNKGEVIGIEILNASKLLKPVMKPLYQHTESVGQFLVHDK